MSAKAPKDRDEAHERAAELEVALDALGDKVKLLVERSRRLAERCHEEESVRRRLEGGLDPVALDERVRELESENERIARHAEFLETKIKELLARVRYVVET
jgi:chromosome segregation ATPase